MPRPKNDPFDPYYKWLGISKTHRPPTHYQLLGVSPDESVCTIIEDAAERQKSLVANYRGTEFDRAAAQILYEIEEAQACLLAPEMRKEYDRQLRERRCQRKKRAARKRRGIPSQTGGGGGGLDIVPTYFKIVGILLAAFMIMAGFSFWLPWQEVVFDNPDDKQPHAREFAGNPSLNAPAAPISANVFKKEGVGVVKQTKPVGEARAFRGHQKAVNSVTFSSDGELVASGSDDRTLRIWDVKTGETMWTASPFTTRVLKVSFSPDGQQVLASDRRKLYVFESKAGEKIDDIEIGVSDFVDISRDGHYLLKTHEQGDLVVFDLKTKRQFLRQQRGAGTSIGTFDPSSEHVIYGEYALDRQHLSSGQIQNRIILQRGYFEGLAISPDGGLLATASGKLWEDNKNRLGNCLVRVWNLNNGSEISQFSEHQDWVRAVAFSPNGQFLLSGGGGTPDDWHGHRSGADCTLRLWNVEAHELVEEFDGHKAGILSVAFSPDGHYAISGSADKTLRLWRLPDGLSASSVRKTSGRPKNADEDTTLSVASEVLKNGGSLEVKVGVSVETIHSMQQLPTQSFQITAVNVKDNSELKDEHLKFLEELVEIRELILMGTGITGSGLQHLHKLNKLTSLNVAGTGVSDGTLRHLKNMNSLEYLYFGGCSIHGDGLVHLQHLPRLKMLGLIDTQTADSGMKHIAALKNLSELRLRGTKVTDSGARQLLKMVNLRTLDLANTKVSSDMIQRLRLALPNCEISK